MINKFVKKYQNTYREGRGGAAELPRDRRRQIHGTASHVGCFE